MNIVLQSTDPRIEVVDADSDHAFAMAPKLREADVSEISDLTDAAPLVALMESMRSSLRAHTVLVDGEPCIMLGIAVHPDDVECGIPWLLATDTMYRIRDQFILYGPPLADKLFAGFRRLTNFTSADNVVAHRWLRTLGFELGEPLPVGRNGADLILFWRDQSCVSPSPPL
jgi:hypothetical protein